MSAAAQAPVEATVAETPATLAKVKFKAHTPVNMSPVSPPALATVGDNSHPAVKMSAAVHAPIVKKVAAAIADHLPREFPAAIVTPIIGSLPVMIQKQQNEKVPVAIAAMVIIGVKLALEEPAKAEVVEAVATLVTVKIPAINRKPKKEKVAMVIPLFIVKVPKHATLKLLLQEYRSTTLAALLFKGVMVALVDQAQAVPLQVAARAAIVIKLQTAVPIVIEPTITTLHVPVYLHPS